MSQLYVAASAESSASTRSCDCLAHRFGNAADHPDRRQRYGSDMTDGEWRVVRRAFPTPAWMDGRGGRPESYCHRQLIDAVRYLVDNGIKWRAMPADFPPFLWNQCLSTQQVKWLSDEALCGVDPGRFVTAFGDCLEVPGSDVPRVRWSRVAGQSVIQRLWRPTCPAAIHRSFAVRSSTSLSPAVLLPTPQVPGHITIPTRPGAVHGGHGRRRPRAVVQPSTARKLRAHHPSPPVRAGQAPGRRARGGDPRRCRLPGPGRPDRWPGGDTTAPQVQEERPGLVRGDARTPAQGTLLTPYPGRARHRPSEELAGPGPPPRPPRAHERHHPSRRRPAVSPADRGPEADRQT